MIVIIRQVELRHNTKRQLFQVVHFQHLSHCVVCDDVVVDCGQCLFVIIYQLSELFHQKLLLSYIHNTIITIHPLQHPLRHTGILTIQLFHLLQYDQQLLIIYKLLYLILMLSLYVDDFLIVLFALVL